MAETVEEANGVRNVPHLAPRRGAFAVEVHATDRVDRLPLPVRAGQDAVRMDQHRGGSVFEHRLHA